MRTVCGGGRCVVHVCGGVVRGNHDTGMGEEVRRVEKGVLLDFYGGGG